jgi:hypothetical protein
MGNRGGGGAEAHEVKQRWLTQALHNAGIDERVWHPGAGVDANRGTIERVYGYYAQLYLRNTFLEWAGMATLVGPAFYAGFRDLGALPDAARRAVAYVFGRASRRLARWAAGDLGRYETTFLVMQKKIFEDQAVMHEAYLGGGLAAIGELRDRAIIDDATFEAWGRIDASKRNGAKAALDDGNRELLFREQHDIIDRFYMRMFEDLALGRLFTYLLTLVGAPSLPQARSYAEVFPFAVRLTVDEQTSLALATPFAAGNIALFADRWALIEADTLPDYLRLIHDRSAEADKLIGTPISERVGSFRLFARLGTLARNFLTHWALRRVGVAGAPAAAIAPAAAASVSLDLRRPPDSVVTELPPGRSSRIWEGRSRERFDLLVRLPGDRVYHASATRAALLASRRGQPPDRLIVTRPSFDLDGARREVQRFAADWNIPADALDDWQGRAQLRARREGDYRSRAYSTQILTAADLGPVKLQLQVAQHIQEDLFVITAQFTWPS